MAYPEDIRPITVEIEINSEWVSITPYVLGKESCSIRRGSGAEDNSMPPTRMSLTLNNMDGRFSEDNPLSPYYPYLGMNTAIRYSIEEGGVTYRRFVGEVIEWPVEYDTVAANSTVSVEAAGWFRRWERAPIVDSPLQRTYTASTLDPFSNTLAYWSFEDEGVNTSTLVSGLPDKPRTAIKSPVGIAGYSGFDGSRPVVKMETGQLFCPVAPHASTNQYVLKFLCFTTGVSVNDTTVCAINFSSGTISRLHILIDNANGDLQMVAFDRDGVILGATGYDGAFAIDDDDVMLTLDMSNSAGISLILTVHTQGSSTVVSRNETIAGQTFGTMADLTFGYHNDFDAGIGHVYVGANAPTNDADITDAFQAYRAERAGDRFLRVCAENGVLPRFIGATVLTKRMGPQPLGTIDDILRDCADTTHSLIFESRDELGVTMIPLDTLYNGSTWQAIPPGIPVFLNSADNTSVSVAEEYASSFRVGVQFQAYIRGTVTLVDPGLFTVTDVTEMPDSQSLLMTFTAATGTLFTTSHDLVIIRNSRLELDYSAHEIQPPAKPVRDDRLAMNRVTLRRPGGSEFTAVAESGPRSIHQPPHGMGLAPESRNSNVRRDSDLALNAQWLVSLGTQTDARWPSIDIALHHSSLAGRQAEVLGLDIGHAILITNAQSIHIYEPIRQLCRGYLEVFDGNRLHSISATGVPEIAYHSLTFDDTAGFTGTDGRWSPSSTTLGETIDATQTGTVLIDMGNAEWTTDPADFPLDILVGGERMTITAATSPAASVPALIGTATTATANAGTLAPSLPVGTLSGHTVFIYVTVRSLTSTALTGVADWGMDQFDAHGSGKPLDCYLLWRVYDGVWTMPSIGVTGDAAGDTGLAQAFTFSNLQTEGFAPDRNGPVVGPAGWQSIPVASGGMAAVQGAYGLRLVVGSKTDDWTSAALTDGRFTEISELTSTLGNDAGAAVYYAVDSSSGSWPTPSSTQVTVTGGAAGSTISKVFFVPASSATPQSFTVSTRSVNGAVKGHAAGIPVDVADPWFYSL